MTDTQKRILYFWLGIVVSYVLPLFILSLKYDLFKKYTETGRKVSFWVLVILIFLLFELWESLKGFIKSMNYTRIRAYLLELMRIAPYILLLSSAILVNYFAKDYVFVMSTLSICFMAATPFRAEHSYYDLRRKVARGDMRVIKE